MPDAETVLAALRAVIEATETLRIIEPEQAASLPEFRFETDYYIEFGLYTHIDPEAQPVGGMRPLQREFTRLLADLRAVMQRKGLIAGACRPFQPPLPAGPDEARIHFRLGAYIFLAAAGPGPTGWRLGLSINADPDAIEDDQD